MIGLLATYLRPYARTIALILGLLLVGAIGNLYLPNLQGDIINNGVVKGDTNYILRVGGLMLLVTAIVGVTAIVAVYFSSQVAMGFGRDVRAAIFTKVQSFSQVEVNQFGPASLITRNTNDVQQVQQVIFVAMTIMVSAPILIVGGIFLAVRTDPGLSGLLLVILPIMALVIGLTFVRLVPLFRTTQAKIDRINQVMRETLSGVRVIRAFVRTRHEEARFETASRDLYDVQLQAGRIFAITQPVIFAIFNLSTVAVLWFGAARVNSGDLSIGNLTAFLQYLLQILFATLTAVFLFILVPRAAVSSGRIQEVLTTEPSIHDPDLAVVPASDGPDRGVVEFRDVEFRYPGAEQAVLHKVSFRAMPGRTTAIVGSTGSGKSTLVNLVPRFYDATSGAVLVEGVDVKAMNREDLWERIGLIPQKAFLFSGTVGSNLRFGKADATDEELWRALEIAQGKDFVEEMSGGLDAEIVQGGTNVSGGQRQRLSIARAIAKGAPIYVFDDSFSALDFATDARLRAALERELGQATLIIVAQRVGTIINADQIIVMDNGAVVGIGTHRQLLETNETYREIVYSQLSESEAVA
jgi:ATP-binding cassette subfamily B protein